MADRPVISKTHRRLIGAVGVGAFIIAGIGFAGSYSAVRLLATHKGFGLFAWVFPIGVDVGIAVLLSLDLVLTWLRIPFPLLRQAAWVLTTGTIVFNAATSFGDPLAMSMHAIIPLLFIVIVEAARHAVGRIADITADRYMESVRLIRWILSPVPTFRLWRRMKLWELRSYDEVVRLEQTRLVYRTHLRAQYGRAWRYRAPLEMLLPLKLARYGVPLDLDMVRPKDQDAPALEAPVAHNQPHPQPLQQPFQQPLQQSAVPQEDPFLKPAAAQPQPQPPMQPRQPAQPMQAAQPRHAGPQHAQQAAPSAHPQAGVQAARAQAAPPVNQLALNALNTVVRSRHRRPLGDPDGTVEQSEGAEPEGAPLADQSTRGIGWLPNQQPPMPNPGPEAWFSRQSEQEDLELFVTALVNYLDAHGQEPGPEQLSEYLVNQYGAQVAPALLDRHWGELRRRYAERVESSS
ncbi:DUF2637 domain-containing protein [Streptacidiphilus fuscans]|uniref:DUF2637 domain-containing protein n=1 Tax=Streptacidiphilus fuscans TaxID=2789292 RepID=A0A931FDS9_9ACTN|nr:DUF2637 domain-containing protein [Streptacidiphilus fuscans]MBF9067941.1 DUF2637 domain-containing protein [Streptacidiphilus fuscans]